MINEPKTQESAEPRSPETETTIDPAKLPEVHTKVHLEIEYDLLRSTLTQRCKAPTVLIGAILRRASRAVPVQIPEIAEGAPRRVIVDIDLVKEEIQVQTDASPLLYDGILFMAESMVTQSQAMHRVQAMLANPSRPKLHLPS